MNRTLKIIIISVITIVVCYAAYYIFIAAKYSHTLVWQTTANKYLWFFKDSVRNDLDSNFSYSYVQKHDIYNGYIYKDIFYITIWEFKDLKSIDLNNITFNKVASIEYTKFSSGETINVHSSPEITMKFNLDFDNGMKVSYDEGSEVDSTFRSEDYIGFYGNINKMLLRDVQLEPKILFNYTSGRQYGLFIFYKYHKKFYLLIINSDKQFDPQNLIQIFNLK